MSEIIAKWLQSRLGLVIDMTPENFALKMANGYLLAQILQKYQIICEEELQLIVECDLIKLCYENYKLINLWLKRLNLTLEADDIYEIVNAIGTASLHLFYQVFLEVQDKTGLDFIADNALKAQLGTRSTRFRVRKVRANYKPAEFNLYSNALCEPILAGGDVRHWYKDRLDTLQNRCNEAREEYVHSLNKACNSCGLVHPFTDCEYNLPTIAKVLTSRHNSSIKCPDKHEDVESLDERTYEELVNQQNKAQALEPFMPNSNENKKIMKNLKVKNKTRQENKIFRNELHSEIIIEFSQKIDDEKNKAVDTALTRMFLRQSEFEKQLVSKMAQIKGQKEYIVENKLIQDQTLNRLKEEEFVEALILKDKELDEKKVMYYLERERILKLHQKIWDEKQRLRRERNKELCSSTVKDIADIAIKISEYRKKYGVDPSRREMDELKNIFISGQPVFDVVQPVIRIIKENDDEIPEEIICREVIRQNAIDYEAFESYINLTWPWELKNIDYTPEMLNEISCGLNVLGHIVHKVLLAKYPLPPLPEKPNFPEATIKVCINGLNDLTVLPTLRNLLSEREIQVIELQEVVDFCLEAYKKESRQDFEDELKEERQESKSDIEKVSKKIKKGAKTNSKKALKATDATEQNTEEITKVFENKLVQTPIIYPCEEIPLSMEANLGKTAQEVLSSGQPLTDFILVAMFIEYLKSIPNLKGWVLVNFPTNYEQAAILEEAFTGVSILDQSRKFVADRSIYEIVSVDGKNDKDLCSIEVDDTRRKSYLLPDPSPEEERKVYDTILTAYIKTKKFTLEGHSGEATLPPILEEIENELDPLDRFYSDTGVNYSMYYKELDFASIKYLGKLILGDYSMPLKTSLELFGDALNYVDGESGPKSARSAKKGEKVPKPREKVVKSQPNNEEPSEKNNNTKGKKGNGKKAKAKVVIVHEDKSVQVPEVEEEIEEIFQEEPQALPTAGQAGWEYTNVPCPEELEIVFATLWEDVEEIYIEDIKQLFFLKRLNLAAIMPFAQYVKDHMKKIINVPDYKAHYLAKFQTAFNTFDMDFRKDVEFKAEMHCRIEDFKEKLLEMCDQKMIDAENARCKIINGNWATTQICELLNNYINMFQIEMDRYMESIRFIDDYYLTVFTGMPSDVDVSKEETFPKFSSINSEVINKMFENVDSEEDLTYFNDVLATLFQKANSNIKKHQVVSSSNMDKIKSAQAANPKGKSKVGTPKSKSTKDDTKKTGIESDIVKENFEKLIEEWQCAVKGESLRVALRFDLLKVNALEVFDEFIRNIRATYHAVYKEIHSKYWKEVENVENACRVFRAAAENEKPVQKELIFIGDTFYINPEVNLFENPLIIPELDKETVEEGAFTIAQLSTLVDTLLDLSPNGYLPTASFTYILQDFIWTNPEDDCDSMAPILWRNLNPSGLKRVIGELFDDLEYVHWRDFIVYNLRVSFPSEREMLLSRKSLRDCDPDSTELVADYQFCGTKLWFELSFQEEQSSRIKEIKKLLYKMYMVENHGLNYTALFLDFCKDENPLVGFVKALELSLGKLICWDKEVGQAFVDQYLRELAEHEENVRKRDAERAECFKEAYALIDSLVEHVTHIYEDVIIEDIIEEKPAEGPKNTLKKPEENGITRNSKDKEEIKDIGNSTEREDGTRKDSEVDTQKASEDSLRNECKDGEEGPTKRLSSELPNNVSSESTDFSKIAFFLPLDLLITVITASLPWHSKVLNIGDLSLWEKAAEIHVSCQNPDFNSSVLAHEFLNSDDFLKLLGMTNKFTAKDPVKVVKNVLKESK